jgi:hypothetical protein
VFMCRWPNGALSLVSAGNAQAAMVMVKDWDNTGVPELRRIPDFEADFRVTIAGGLETERSLEEIWDRADRILPEPSGGTEANRVARPTKGVVSAGAEHRYGAGKKKPKPTGGGGGYYV